MWIIQSDKLQIIEQQQLQTNRNRDRLNCNGD
jgi:hypothetical protein